MKPKNQRHQQWADRGARLIERFIQTEYPASADRFPRIRKHGVHGGFPNAATDALRDDQSCRDWPLRSQRERRDREHVHGVPQEREHPVTVKFVREISGDRAQRVPHEFAQTRYKPQNGCACA